MPPKERTQPPNKTPVLQMDSSTFQATITVAVASALDVLNANNPSGNGNSFHILNYSNTSGNQQGLI